MTDTPAAKSLTEQLLSIIRQQRHFAARVIIATQEPTISPRLMDLVSATIIHRFSSPEWFSMLRRHLSILKSGEKQAEKLFNSIVSLKVGEALIFASSALLQQPPVVDGFTAGGYAQDQDSELGQATADTGIKKMNSEPFQIKVRRRITSDGGKSVMSL